MATGLDLIFDVLCYNATFCEYYYDNPHLGMMFVTTAAAVCNPIETSTNSDSQLTKKAENEKRLKEELNGQHLRIATYYNYPLSWVETSENGTILGLGVAFVIVDILCKMYNFTYEVVVPSKNIEFGGEPGESLVGLVENDMVDFGAAFVPVLSDYQKAISFSTGLMEDIWVMMLKRPKVSAAGSGLLAPFEFNVWILILVAVVSYGPCITVITKMRSKMVMDKERMIRISPSFWFVYSAFIKQGTTLAPEANTTRVLFATWWIFIILLSAFYTANLTAFLTLSKFTLDVEYPHDLLAKNYRWMARDGGSVGRVIGDVNENLHYLEAMVTKGRAEFRSFDNDVDYLPFVSAGSVLVREQIAVDHLMYNDYLNKAREGIEESQRCTYVVAPNFFMKQIRAFAFPKNSSLLKIFNPLLSHMVEAGLIKHLLHRDLPSTKICPLDLQSNDRKLQNSDLLMTYLIMAAGTCSAISTFIAEMIIKRHTGTKIHPGNTLKKKKKSRRFTRKEKSISKIDSQPPAYETLFGKNSIYKTSEIQEKRIVNGREYWVVDTVDGDKRLIPVRSPSAFLWNH